MLENIKISTILFLDIETAPVVYNYNALDENIKQLWDTKFRYQQSENPETQYKKAGIYAEFSKVICISVGFFNEGTFRIKSFYGHDEKQLLQEFATLLNTHFCRRMLINTVKLPKALNISGKKPWEVNHLDTMELWKFGDYKNYSSLSLLATIFNIPTPKDDINGADVARVYWEEKNLERIVTYCQKDVLTVAQLLLRFMGEPLIEDKNIIQAELNVFSS